MSNPFDELAKDKRVLPLELMPGCSNVVSDTECTGLMPTLPQNRAEEESYEELSSLETPKKKALQEAAEAKTGE